MTPMAIDLEYGRLAIYTIFRLIGGMGFAILLSNTGVLLVRIFGSGQVASISGIFLGTECVIGLGPSLAFSAHVSRLKAGSRSEHSYDIFFICASVLVLLSAVGVVILWRSALRKTRMLTSSAEATITCAIMFVVWKT